MFSPIIRPGGLLLVDTRFVKTERKVDARQKALPMYQETIDKIGNPVAFNICMLGAVNYLAELIKPGSILHVLKTRFRPDFFELNKSALELGRELAERYG